MKKEWQSVQSASAPGACDWRPRGSLPVSQGPLRAHSVKQGDTRALCIGLKCLPSLCGSRRLKIGCEARAGTWGACLCNANSHTTHQSQAEVGSERQMARPEDPVCAGRQHRRSEADCTPATGTKGQKTTDDGCAELPLSPRITSASASCVDPRCFAGSPDAR